MESLGSSSSSSFRRRCCGHQSNNHQPYPCAGIPEHLKPKRSSIQIECSDGSAVIFYRPHRPRSGANSYSSMPPSPSPAPSTSPPAPAPEPAPEPAPGSAPRSFQSGSRSASSNRRHSSSASVSGSAHGSYKFTCQGRNDDIADYNIREFKAGSISNKRGSVAPSSLPPDTGPRRSCRGEPASEYEVSIPQRDGRTSRRLSTPRKASTEAECRSRSRHLKNVSSGSSKRPPSSVRAVLGTGARSRPSSHAGSSPSFGAPYNSIKSNYLPPSQNPSVRMGPGPDSTASSAGSRSEGRDHMPTPSIQEKRNINCYSGSGRRQPPSCVREVAYADGELLDRGGLRRAGKKGKSSVSGSRTRSGFGESEDPGFSQPHNANDSQVPRVIWFLLTLCIGEHGDCETQGGRPYSRSNDARTRA